MYITSPHFYVTYVFVGLLLYPLVLCVTILDVSMETEACCWRLAIAVTNITRYILQRHPTRA
jgi:hypothetical protein